MGNEMQRGTSRLAVIALVPVSVSVIVWLAAGCSNETPAAKCVAGASVECACANQGKGAQVCKPDGTFGPCQCGERAEPDPSAPAEERLAETPKNNPAKVAPKVAAGPDCDVVAAHLKVLLAQDLEGISADDFAEQCRREKLSVEVRTCMAKATDSDALIGCQALKKYTAKSKTAEGRQFVKKLFDGARQYYMNPPNPGLTPIPPQFPGISVGPTPRLGSCCQQGGQCKPSAGQWESDTWIALQFSVDDPHYYSYEYVTKDPHKSFVARAYGDLDCDGIYSTFEMVGAIDENSPDGPSGNQPIRVINELE